MAWTLARWPDARRVPVGCTVVAHTQPKGGKSGHDGKVRVRVADEEHTFSVVNGFASQETAKSVFDDWPIGSERTCWKLPYPTREYEITGSGASWFPPLVLLALGAALSLLAMLRMRAPALTVDAPIGHPFREAADRPPPPRLLVIDARACSRSSRRIAWVALGFWTLLFGSFFVLSVTAPSPAGSLLEPGSMARAGAVLFALIALGIPGGVLFWPAMYTLLSKTTVWLDGAGGVAGTARGVPGLRRVRWAALSPDATRHADALTGGDPESAILALPPMQPNDAQMVDGWLAEWRDR